MAEGGIYMKKHMLFVLISFIVILSAGCDIKKTDLTNNSNKNEINTSAVTVPKPNSDASVDWECGIYYSSISALNMEDYLQKLKDNGWKDMHGSDISADVDKGTSEYMLTKGNKILQIMMFLMDQENAISNSVLVKLDEEVPVSDIKNRKGTLSKSEALDQIQTIVDGMVDSGEIASTKETITGLIEIFIKEAFEKMNIQAYAAMSDNGFAGCFLIHNGVVSYVRGRLDNTCVADIDGDGEYELLDLYAWYSGIYRIELSAYEYSNPVNFNSLTEVPTKKFYNCFVPNSGNGELSFKKVDDLTVMLIGPDDEYGIIKVDGTSLLLDDMENFPFEQWSKVYDQKLLLNMVKEIPKVPPEIIISIDGYSMDYVVQPTNWDGKDYETENTFTNIINKDQFIPTFLLAGIGDENSRNVVIDFGNSIPDCIIVYDAMLNQNGGSHFNESERTVAIINNNQVEFNLSQHMAYYLSSNLEDYKKDWFRLFRLACKWGENECEYAFLINTGTKESLTEIVNNKFLICEGTYSSLMSDWDIGLSIDKEDLPDQYIIEWHVSDGNIKKWNEKDLMPIDITDIHYGYPMTSSDDNNGGVIWAPQSFDKKEDVTIEAYIYENVEDNSPIAYSQIIISNTSGTFKEKE